MKNYNFTSSFNPTVAASHGGIWVSDGYYGLDAGIIILMIENYRSGFVWKLMQKNKYLSKGLQRPGFRADGCKNKMRGTLSMSARWPHRKRNIEDLYRIIVRFRFPLNSDAASGLNISIRLELLAPLGVGVS